MRGIKIPLQNFALKMQGGLCARGGVFAGHYGIVNKRISTMGSHTVQRETFAGENSRRLAKNKIFVKKTFVDCSWCRCQKALCPPISRRKFSAKPQILKSFLTQ